MEERTSIHINVHMQEHNRTNQARESARRSASFEPERAILALRNAKHPKDRRLSLGPLPLPFVSLEL